MSLDDSLELEPSVQQDLTYRATAGSPLTSNIPHATQDDIIAAIKAVQDPELLLNVYELGLIYDIKQEIDGNVFVLMTLTSPTCPMAGEMPTMVANAVASVPGVGQVVVELTFDPPWTVERMSEDIRLMMGF
jgi:FeS assembly SUF system protein